MDPILRRLALVAAAVAAALAIGTAGYVLFAGYSVFDAFYMAAMTITTVGYFEVRPLNTVGRAFNVFYMLLGVSVLLIAIGAMTQTAIELELNQYFGKRRQKRMINQLRDHYIVCGFGRVGRGAAESLRRERVPFVVLDRDPERVERAQRLEMLAMTADATRDESLRQAGIERARGLIASLASDADNVFVTLSARTLNPALHLSARVSEDEAEAKMRRAGADFVYAPYHITGHRMAQALLRPHVQQFLEFTVHAGEDFVIEQVRVAEASPAAGRTIEELKLRREHGVIVLAIRRADGRMEFSPPAAAAAAGGDYLIVMGQPGGLRNLERMLGAAV
jgi:voltage-gated potassium channel